MCKIYRLSLKCSVLMLGLLSRAMADTDTDQQIRLSFIYNFAKFVTWPNLTVPTDPLVICVIGSQLLGNNIALLQDKKVNEHPIQVRFLEQAAQTAACNMLFVGDSESRHLDKILQPIATQPILTVSTIADFVQAAGMIGLKDLDNKVRFDINLNAAQAAGLSVSSQLSSLADEVIQ